MLTDLEILAIVLLSAAPFVVWRMIVQQNEIARMNRCYKGLLTGFKNVSTQNKDLRRQNETLRQIVPALASQIQAMRQPAQDWITQQELEIGE